MRAPDAGPLDSGTGLALEDASLLRQQCYVNGAWLDASSGATLPVNNPATGAPLVSQKDGKRHYEIFRGESKDGGRSFVFQPLTRDSTADNLRPIVPRTDDGREIVLWLRGVYRSYTDYELEVVGSFPGR